MAEITIQVPAALAERLAAVRDRLPEVLAVGLKELSPLPNEVYRYVLEFLASNPSPEAILDFDLSPPMRERATELLARERTEQLAAAEVAELDEYARIDNILSTLKTGALRRVKAAS
jgi:hypothetical protein